MVIIGSKIDEVRVDGRIGQMEKDLKHYEAIGLQAAEIPPHGLDVIKNGRLDEKATQKVADLLSEFNMIYSVHAPNPVNLMHRENPALHEDVLRAALQFTEAIGSRTIVYHPGRFLDEEDFPLGIPKAPEERQPLLMQSEAATIAGLADEFKGITICMENARPYLQHSPYCYAERIDLLKEQVLRIDRSNVRIILDIGHMYMSSKFYGIDPVEAARDIRGLIAHTHVHDNFGSSIYQHQKQQTHLIPFGMGDSHMPVGWGGIPIRDILATYISSYEGMLMMELRSRYFEHTEESKNNLEGILADLEDTCNK